MKRYRPTEDGMAVSETGMWVRQTDAAELQRLLDIAHNALRAIRGAGYNTTAWATWAQRTAAWGMAPSKWPKQPDDAPAEDYTAELQRQLGETKAALADLLQQIEACDGTAQLNIECAKKAIKGILK